METDLSDVSTKIRRIPSMSVWSTSVKLCFVHWACSLLNSRLASTDSSQQKLSHAPLTVMTKTSRTMILCRSNLDKYWRTLDLRCGSTTWVGMAVPPLHCAVESDAHSPHFWPPLHASLCNCRTRSPGTIIIAMPLGLGMWHDSVVHKIETNYPMTAAFKCSMHRSLSVSFHLAVSQTTMLSLPWCVAVTLAKIEFTYLLIVDI